LFPEPEERKKQAKIPQIWYHFVKKAVKEERKPKPPNPNPSPPPIEKKRNIKEKERRHCKAVKTAHVLQGKKMM
jgi:hypothetical protein